MNEERLIDRIVAGVLEQLRTPPETVPTHGRAEHLRRTDFQSVRQTAKVNGQGGYQNGSDGLTIRPTKSETDGLEIRPTEEADAVAVHHRLVLDDKVITGDLLEQRINGAQRLVIGPKTILTPSARDFLRSRNIDWSRGEATHNNTQTGQVWKAIISRSTPAVVSALDQAARSQAVCWERELVGTTREAAAAAVSTLCKAEAVGAVVFAEAAEAVACLANRNGRIRAAVVQDVRHVETLRRTTGVNLFCINPAARSHFELRNLLRQITSGSPKLPDGWHESI